MYTIKRLSMALVLILVVSFVVVSCDAPPEGTSTTITVTNSKAHCGVGNSYSTYCPLNNSGGGPFPAIEVGSANSCIDTRSDVAGRSHTCRVVDGYDTGRPGDPPALRDTRNWLITIHLGNVAGIAHRDDYRYGEAVVLYSGEMFEGCELIDSYPFNPDPTDKNFLNTRIVCDYRIRKPVVTNTSTNEWKNVLLKAWHWSGYVGSVLGCAGGLAGIMAGVGKVTFPLLRGCVDGPMK